MSETPDGTLKRSDAEIIRDLESELVRASTDVERLTTALEHIHTWLAKGLDNGDEGRFTDGRLRAMVEDAFQEANELVGP